MMETQTCFCVPTEDGMDIYASTQWATIVQQNVGVILKMPMNRYNIDELLFLSHFELKIQSGSFVYPSFFYNIA